MKKFILGVVLGGLLFGSTSAIAASEIIKAYTSEYVFTVDGKEVELKNPIVVINNRAYLPVRDIGDSLGYDMTFTFDGKIDASINPGKFPEIMNKYVSIIVEDKAKTLLAQSKSNEGQSVAPNNSSDVVITF